MRAFIAQSDCSDFQAETEQMEQNEKMQSVYGVIERDSHWVISFYILI